MKHRIEMNDHGEWHGLAESFRKDGTIKRRRNYKHDKRNGLSEKFRKDGTIEARYNFKNGKRHGLAEEFYADGTLMARLNFKHGELHGLSEWFYGNGTVETLECYNKGKNVLSGFLSRECCVLDGLPIYVESLGRYATPDDDEYPEYPNDSFDRP